MTHVFYATVRIKTQMENRYKIEVEELFRVVEKD